MRRANLSTYGRRFIATLLLGISLSGKAGAEGYILIKGNPMQVPEFWTPVGFKKVERFGVAVKVDLMNGQTRSFRSDETGSIIEVPVWSSLSAVNSSDWDKIRDQRNALSKQAVQYPQIKAWINSLVTRFDTILVEQANYKVLINGQLMSSIDYQKQFSTTPTGSSALTLADKTYQNLKVISVAEGQVRIMHDGGSAAIRIKDLTSDQITKLKSLSPALFGKYMDDTEAFVLAKGKEGSKISMTDALTERTKQDKIRVVIEKIKAIPAFEGITLVGGEKVVLTETEFPTALFEHLKTECESMYPVTFRVIAKLPRDKFPELYENAYLGTPALGVYEVAVTTKPAHGAVIITDIDETIYTTRGSMTLILIKGENKEYKLQNDRVIDRRVYNESKLSLEAYGQLLQIYKMLEELNKDLKSIPK